MGLLSADSTAPVSIKLKVLAFQGMVEKQAWWRETLRQQETAPAAPAAHQVNWESLALGPPCVLLYIANTDVSSYSQYAEKHLSVSWFKPS